MYKLANVSKAYSTVSVFSDVSLTIPTDRFVFIMGPSGSGKSTLLRLLSFIDAPDTGTLELALGDERFTSGHAARPWPKVTCVFQRQFLWPHLTIRQNILLPMRVGGRVDGAERLLSVARLFSMESFLDRYPNEVSGGEAQRAALARALVLDPSLVLIDEVHGGLDLEQQAAVNRCLLGLRDSGVGLIVVTHSLAFAQRYADLLLVVEGRSVSVYADVHDLASARSPFLRRIVAP